MQRPDFSARPHDVLDILEVHDGDTVRLLLDTSFEQASFPWLRLRNYSCPELSDAGGSVARDATAGLLETWRGTIWVVTYKIPLTLVQKLAKRYGSDKRSFARYVADIWLGSDLLLGDELVRLGYAKPGAFVG